MKKVKVSKEVAIALDAAKLWLGEENYKKWILDSYHKGSLIYEKFDDLEKVLWKYEIYEVAEILFNGYEVEETPEEKILKCYEDECFDEYDKGVNSGITFTLNALGIKIKGINS